MALAQGNGVLLLTQCVPAQPHQQNTPIGQNTGWFQKFIKGEPKSLGVVQIMIGIIHICLGAILCSTPFITIAVLSGVVFWAPIFYCISGGLSISAETKRNCSQVKGGLGMNIVSSVVASIAFIICIIDLWEPLYSYNYCNDYYNSDCYRNLYAVQTLQNGILGVLVILSLLEFTISISTSAFGCKSVCGHSGSQATQPVFVVQNAYAQDPRFQKVQTTFGIPIAQGMPLMGPGMTKVQETPMVQGIPASYIGMTTAGIPLALGVARTPLPTTETPPSYYKNIPGNSPLFDNESLRNP